MAEAVARWQGSVWFPRTGIPPLPPHPQWQTPGDSQKFPGTDFQPLHPPQSGSPRLASAAAREGRVVGHVAGSLGFQQRLRPRLAPLDLPPGPAPSAPGPRRPPPPRWRSEGPLRGFLKLLTPSFHHQARLRTLGWRWRWGHKHLNGTRLAGTGVGQRWWRGDRSASNAWPSSSLVQLRTR